MKAVAIALSSIVLGAAFSQGAAAQAAYGGQNERRIEVSRYNQPGAGAAGGAGGGAGGTAADWEGTDRDTSYSRRMRTSTPPPLDPSRRIYEVDCTRPFNALGKGNLRCI